MFASFFRYFLSYILKARTRQRLLFLALFSLGLSSFALVVLQGVMNGLQSSLVSRSKLTYGEFYLDVSQLEREHQDELLEDLSDFEVKGYPEIETELLVRHETHISPMILHGVNFKDPMPFLKGYPHSGVILGADLSRKLQAYYGGQLQMVTPSEMNNLLGDIPRSSTDELVEIIQTDVAEIDLVHGWIRESAVFNLLRDRSYSKIRFSNIEQLSKVQEIILPHCSLDDCPVVTWEQKHESLQWALNLESRMMLFLFIAMALLVAICITAGLLIFYDKVKRDLASFWIMGMDKSKLYRMSSLFTYLLNAIACLSGVVIGYGFLKVLELYSHDLMPDVFVERSLPVSVSAITLLSSFGIPMLISLTFSMISVHYILKEESSFLNIVRGQSS